MRKFIKIVGYIIMAAFVMLTILYIILISQAKSLVSEYVSAQSGGTVSVKMKSLRLSFSHARLEAGGIRFFSTPKAGDAITYEVNADSLMLQLHDLGSLIIKRKILVDTVVCIRPLITVNKRRVTPASDFSLTGQMGKVYDGLNRVLDNLDISYCLLDSGSFTLIDKVQKNAAPITITDFYLRIDNLSRASTQQSPNRFLFTDRIRFYSSGQHIEFPDGRHGMSYSRLRINSLRRSIEIDSCRLFQKKKLGEFSQFDISFDTLRLSGVDFRALTHENLVKADSALCIRPSVDFRIELQESRKQTAQQRPLLSKDSMQHVLRNLLGDVDLGFTAFHDAQIRVQSKLGRRINTYEAKKNNLVLEEIRIVRDTAIPLHIGAFKLDMYGYTSYNPDSSYYITFDSILFRNDKILLSSFALRPSVKNRESDGRKDIRMRFLQIEDISWYELLGNKRLDAGSITMIEPDILVTASFRKKTSSKSPGPIYQSFKMVSGRMDLSRLRIIRGNFDFISGEQKHFRLEGVNTEMGVRQLLASENINDLSEAVDRLSFDAVRISGGNMSLVFKEGFFLGKKRTMESEVFMLHGGTNPTSLLLGKVRLQGFYQKSPNQYHLGDIRWQEGYVTISPQDNMKNRGDAEMSDAAPIQFSADSTGGRNTTVIFKKDRLSGSVRFQKMESSRIDWQSGKEPEITGLSLEGDQLSLSSGRMQLTGGEFRLDSTGSVNNINLYVTSVRHKMHVTIPRVSFLPDMITRSEGKARLSGLVINDPVIRIRENRMYDSSYSRSPLPELTLDRFRIVNPFFESLPSGMKLRFNNADAKSSWYFNKLVSEAAGLKADSIHVNISGISGEVGRHSFSFGSGQGAEADITDLYYPNTSGQSAISASIPRLFLGKGLVTIRNNDESSLPVSMDFIEAGGIELNKQPGDEVSLLSVLRRSSSFFLRSGNLQFNKEGWQAGASGLAYLRSSDKIHIDSFYIRPADDRETYNQKRTFQSDHISFFAPGIEMRGVLPESMIADSALKIPYLKMNAPELFVYRDKRRPFLKGIIRPLPVMQLQGISKPFAVDSILLRDADITYEEVNEKTGRSGKVKFTHVDAVLENLKNDDLHSDDSLCLSATADFMDSARLRMSFRESYSDTLHGFSLALRLAPFNLAALNPMMEPLASVRVLSGRLDSFRMHAIGREHAAYGKMKMYYSGLRVKILGAVPEERTSFLGRLKNFGANLFLKSNNRKGAGEIFFERDKERSVFNYWVKMIVSGVGASTGIRPNNGKEKKYDRTTRNDKLPEIPDMEP